MKNFRIFTTTYVQATAEGSSYVKLYDCRNKVSVKLSTYHSKSDDASEIAEEFLNTKGIKIIGRGSLKKGYALITDNFENQIK